MDGRETVAKIPKGRIMTQSRLDFEEWAQLRGYDTRRWYDGYHQSDTGLMWRGWSARDESFLKLMEKI